MFFEANPRMQISGWRRRFTRPAQMHFTLWDNFPLGGFNDCAVIFFSPCLVSVCTRRYLNPCIYISPLLYIFSILSLVDLSRARCVLCGITNLFCKLQTRASLTTIVHALRWYRYKSEAHHLGYTPRRDPAERESGEKKMLWRWTRAFGPSRDPPVLCNRQIGAVSNRS